VKANGKAVEVAADGRFGVTTWTRGQGNEVRIEAERDGRKKTTGRCFRVRK